MEGVRTLLEIRPCLDKPVVAAYCKKCGKIPTEAFYVYLAANRGETLAAGLFEITSTQVCALLYESGEEDAFLFDGVLRAGLNYAAEYGIPNGFIPEEFRLLHRDKFQNLSYPIQQKFNISNFFAKYKSCANADG